MYNNISTNGIKKLMLSHSFFIAAKTLFDIFLNVYIWKLTASLKIVAIYWIIYLIAHTIFFTIFASRVKKGYTKMPKKLSVLGYIASAIILLVLQEKAIEYIVPLSLLIGFASGTYWISYQITRFDATHTKNRGNYTGYEKGIKKTIGILLPVLGGFIITTNFFGINYGGVFLLSTIFFIISFIIGGKNSKINKNKKLQIRKTIKIIFKQKDIVKAMYSYVLSGFSRTGSIEKSIIPLVIFHAIGNELQLGGWLSLFSAISVITSIIIGKYIRRKYYKTAITYSGILLVLSILLLIGIPTFWTMIIFAIVREIITLFIMIPKRVISENLIHEIPDYQEYRVEYIIIREWCGIMFGRVLSYVILLFVVSLTIHNLKYFFILMVLAITIEIFLLRSIKKSSYRQQLKCGEAAITNEIL